MKNQEKYSKNSAKLLTNQQFLTFFRKNNRLEPKNRLILRFNKRHLRADVLSLLSSALRPRLLGVQKQIKSEATNSRFRQIKNPEQTIHHFWAILNTNRCIFGQKLIKIVVASTILFGFSVFLANFSTPVYAGSLTLTIPSEPLSLDLNPSVNNGFATTSSSFNLKTDNSSGYTISVKSKNEASDNSLINGSNKLASIAKSTTADNFKSDSKFLNTWGWLPSKLNSEENTNYQPAPEKDDVLLDSTTEANETGADYTISLAAKVDASTPTGNYSNTFVITSIANPPKIDGIMQDWDGCDDLGMEESVRLQDTRDGTVYTVAKLRDGKCWMVEDLKLGGEQSIILTSDDSDVAKDYTLSQALEPGYAGYYNWPTATAGTGSSSFDEGQIAPSSICPKGWKLPTGGRTGEYLALYNAYADDGSLLHGGTPNFTLGGYYTGYYPPYNFGVWGWYWSSTASSSSMVEGDYWFYNAHNFEITVKGYFNHPDSSYTTQSDGLLVRCLVRQPKKITDLQYLQDWADLNNDEKSQVMNSMEEGTKYTLKDKRDSAEYTVAKLKDGNLWMMQDLRIIDKTITSADSDVTSSFTIPSSTRWTGCGMDSNHAYYTSNRAYYTWYTATAGTGTASQATNGWNAPSSICPKGWKLPSGGTDNSDYALLAGQYSIPPNLATGGNLDCESSGSVNLTGQYGLYWSSTAKSSSSAYRLLYKASTRRVNPSDSLSGGWGYPIQCLARQP